MQKVKNTWQNEGPVYEQNEARYDQFKQLIV